MFFLADLAAKEEILTVFCKVDGFSKNEAKEKVETELKAHKSESTYAIKYVGIIDFHDIDKELIERQNELFDKYDSVWILNCSYR
ncbi:catabolite regulation protein CreA [Pullulanibacillus pueri]|nr:catabolite regulation protein CreA [Pullulanibacillus pueri]